MDTENKIHLLRRPSQQSLITEIDRNQGINAYWKAKAVIYKRKSDALLRVSMNTECSVIYANLHITGKYQTGTIIVPLVQICYVESNKDQLEIRGISFRLTIKGVKNVAEVRDAIRFLVVRQRIPHRILGLPFEWEHKSRTDVIASVQNQHLITCFSFRYLKNLFNYNRKIWQMLNEKFRRSIQ